MKSQHVVWVGVLGASTIVGVLLGSAVTHRQSVRASAEPAAPVLARRESSPVVDTSMPALLPNRPEATFLDPDAVRVAELEEAGEEPAADEAEAPPSVLPAPNDAAPIDRRRERLAREMVDRELPNATDAERDVWLEELKGLPPEVMQEVLRIRRGMGRIAPLPKSATPFPPGIPSAPPREPEPSPRSEADPALQTAAVAVAQAIGVVRHNVANASTPGFKRLRPVLGDHGYVAIGTEHGTARSIGGGCRLSATLLDETPGPLRETGRPWDVAIEGPGWFQLWDGDGSIVYTRRGFFTVDLKGRLAIRAGANALPIEPRIDVPSAAASLVLAPDGSVGLSSEPDEPLGRLQLARFANAGDLRPLGDGLYAATSATGEVDVAAPGADGTGELRQGTIEESNVDLDAERDALGRLLRHRDALRSLGATVHGTGGGEDVPWPSFDEEPDVTTSLRSDDSGRRPGRRGGPKLVRQPEDAPR